ncbi:hypothetical protein [Vulcaniibacterium gelatinicum]|uniref:hypothetical protein n=1 Tax=Vulcaniibacterium gelatinicum TaxID=2598725 RepID=UPI0011C75D8E|nr:hypothetical protein [Vulcaniibacterium gelatinicum]
MSTPAPPPFDPRLDRLLRRLTLGGLLLVLLLPAARGHLPLLGWAPLWLVAMPASAWWALHRFRLPRLSRDGRARPRRRPQARRRGRPLWTRPRLPQAA